MIMATHWQLSNKESENMKLHIGGTEQKDGWSILNIQPGEIVDFVGDVCDMSQFADDSVNEIYACHVLEHLSYAGPLQKALRECQRVLKPGGVFRFSVPDLDVLFELFRRPGLPLPLRHHLMRIIYGGQTDSFDFHYVGWTWEFAVIWLHDAGFRTANRVESFGLFNDCSEIQIEGQRISLNVVATTAAETDTEPDESSAPLALAD